MKMKIFAALGDDLGAGFVWLSMPGVPARCVIKISNPASNRSVYCEALQIEKNFLTKYNQSPRFTISDPNSSIVMSSWYRARLGGLETQRDYPLDVQVADGWWGKLRACLHHPQIVVRVAAWLGIVGVVLGIVGLLLGVASLLPRNWGGP